MKQKEKIEKIKKWIKTGHLKILDKEKKTFSVPSEAFILGITPTLISEVLR